MSVQTYHLSYSTIRHIRTRFNDTVTMEELEQVSEDGDDELRALSEPDTETESDSEPPPLISEPDTETESDSVHPPLILPESIHGD